MLLTVNARKTSSGTQETWVSGKVWPDFEDFRSVCDAGLEVSFSGDSVRFGVFKSRSRILKPGSRSLAVSNLQFFTINIDQVPA